MILTLDRLNCFYGRVQVLRDLSLTLAPGEVLCLLGRNGAGKTTTLKTVMGLIRPRSGRVLLGDEDLSRLPAHEIPRRGIAYVPQGRRLFAELTVEENLTIGLMARHRGEAARERVLTLFPVLKQRLHQPAGTLSGGEQEMLAVARALCLEPSVLLLDEPTAGVPEGEGGVLVEVIESLPSDISVLIIEHDMEVVFRFAQRITVLVAGQILCEGTPAEIAANPEVRAVYLGEGGHG
jgi:branched-chain amino acid transport system ATP-binding protein